MSARQKDGLRLKTSDALTLLVEYSVPKASLRTDRRQLCPEAEWLQRNRVPVSMVSPKFSMNSCRWKSQILSTDSEAMPMVIDTTMGQLTLDFEHIELALDTGSPITFQALDEAAEAYSN